MKATLKEPIIWILLSIIGIYTGFQVIRGIINANNILQVTLLTIGIMPIVAVICYSLKQAYKEFHVYRLCNNPTVHYIDTEKIKTEFNDIKETRKN